MKKIAKLFTLIIAITLLFTFTSCTGSNDNNFKTVDLTKDENIEKISNVTVSAINKIVANPAKETENKDLIFIGFLRVGAQDSSFYVEGYEIDEEHYNDTYTAIFVKRSKVEEKTTNYSFVGFLDENDNVKLYTTKSEVTNLELLENAIFVSKDTSTNKVSFPRVNKSGTNFSGWYKTEEFENGTRVAEFGSATGVLYARYITFGEAAIVTVVCVIIVFSMLALLLGITKLLKYFKQKEQVETKEQPVQKVEPKMTTPIVEMDGDEMTRILWKYIKDELLLPFIDLKTEYYDLGLEYRNETKKDVRVVSVKEIK